MKELTLNQKEQARLQVLNRVLEGEIGVGEAARALGVSERHGWQLVAVYRKEGAVALAHGNRGRSPAHKVFQGVRNRIEELAKGPYHGVNQSHLTELLREQEGTVVSRSTVRRIVAAAGVRSPRRRRPPLHRCRRERYSHEGMLLQIDGSRHDWLERRGPYLTLVAGIDDATGTVPYALFREQEDAQRYLLLLQGTIRSKGIPLALYGDRHGIFQRSPRDSWSLEEELEGERQPTQFGRALKELGIQSIFALPPQAKGRIERLFGTLQDRLVVKLRLAGARTLEQANGVLKEFVHRFNGPFVVPPAQPGLAYRQAPEALDLDAVLCFKYRRKVARDNTLRFGGRTLQLLPGLERPTYPHSQVEVQEPLDGSLVVLHRGQIIATTEASADPVTLRARKGPRGTAHGNNNNLVDEVTSNGAQRSGVPGRTLPLDAPSRLAHIQPGHHKPSPTHPWRKRLLTKSLNT